MPAESSRSPSTHGRANDPGAAKRKNLFTRPWREFRRLALVSAICLAPSWATAQSVTSFTIVNADTGGDITTFVASPTGGAVSGVVSVASTPRINVRVNASGVKSVVFGDGAGSRTENSAPYAYKGNSGQVYAKWQPAAGTYDINATPYAGTGGTGLAGPKATLRLTLVGTVPPPVVSEKPATRNEAARFLAQATFGPTEEDIAQLMRVGYSAWIDEQFNKPSGESHLDFFSQLVAVSGKGTDKEVMASFWKQALHGQDQLRLRMAYALSQIFVISLRDSGVNKYDRGVAVWLDLLKSHSLGNYRDLLYAVSTNPMMGMYLSHQGNQKADSQTGRVPDENYAREVMQLFSIGLIKLKLDGSPDKDPRSGALVETYGPSDVSELAKVFTGWSWKCPLPVERGCFLRGSVGGRQDPNRDLYPMVPYDDYHSSEAKEFLGLNIPRGTSAQKSLDEAIKHLANHANVAPFISRQLIQRFTTSNPSPAYVEAVAKKFNDNGAGVRGDLKAVLKEVLMNPEARLLVSGNSGNSSNSSTWGKVREPVLRLSAFVRAFAHVSHSQNYTIELTDSPALALGQAPLHALSVFNFYRPGYVAPGIASTSAANSTLVTPELQIVDETSVAGYVNFMRDSIHYGVGAPAGLGFFRRDLKSEYLPELALAHDAPKLVDHVTERLIYGALTPARRDVLISAVNGIALPAGNASQSLIDAAKRQRVNAAVLLTVTSPEYIVTK